MRHHILTLLIGLCLSLVSFVAHADTVQMNVTAVKAVAVEQVTTMKAEEEAAEEAEDEAEEEEAEEEAEAEEE